MPELRLITKHEQSSEIDGALKSFKQVQDLKDALRDPASANIEKATSTLVSTVLSNALQNMNVGQQQVSQKPILNSMAEIAINNLSSEKSPLPKLLDSLTNVIGQERVIKGYDLVLNYMEEKTKSIPKAEKPPTIIERPKKLRKHKLVLLNEESKVSDNKPADDDIDDTDIDAIVDELGD